MEQFFTDLIAWMTDVPPLWAYAVLLLIAYGENIVPPIPGDFFIVFGGYLVALGRLDFVVVVLLATLGGAAGFMTMYVVGRRVGHAVLDPHRLRWLPKEKIFTARRWIKRWGYGVVAANRFLSGARSVISLTVGMAHMNAGRTAAFATISAAVWTTLIVFAGYTVGDNWADVSVYLRRYGQVVMALLAVLVGIQGLRFYLRRRRAAAGKHADSSEAP